MRTITLAITTYHRYEFLIDCFHQILNDDRISEIVIVSDADEKTMFDKIKTFCDQYPKIKLYLNISNQDCYRNKQIAVAYSTNPFCIIFDSDNVVDKNYIDKVFSIQNWDPKIIYQPVYAQPNFDFRDYSGIFITRENVSLYMGRKMFDTSLNAMNYFVNRDEYLRVWDGSVNPHTADSIYQNYRWLEAGNRIYYVDGLEYFHRVHGESHYKNNNHKTGNFYREVEEKLKRLE